MSSHGGEGSKLSGVSSYRGTNPNMRAPPQDFILTLLPPKAPISKYHHTVEVSASIYEREGHNSVYSTPPLHPFYLDAPNLLGLETGHLLNLTLCKIRANRLGRGLIAFQ